MDPDTFHQLPLQLDGQTKAVSATNGDTKLAEELQNLNTLHRALLSPDAPNAIPPPPVPVNPKRSAQVQKMRETGNEKFKKQQYAEAIKLYSLGIDMAAGRPLWEPSGLVREELHQLYSNRAQAYMGSNNWPEGAVDAQCSVELKKVGNAKAWYRRGKCLLEMGRVDEAREWVAEGLEYEHESELASLAEEIERRKKA
jgi:translocation protein SEC72